MKNLKILNYTGRAFCLVRAFQFKRGEFHYSVPDPNAHRYTGTEIWAADVPLSVNEIFGRKAYNAPIMGTGVEDICGFKVDGNARIVEEEPLKKIAQTRPECEPNPSVQYVRCVELKTQRVVGLPEPREGTFLIVWPEVAAAVRRTGRGTHDLLVPGKPVFVRGDVIGADCALGDFAVSKEMIYFFCVNFHLTCRGFRELSLYDEDGKLQAEIEKLPITADGKVQLAHLVPEPARPARPASAVVGYCVF